MKQIELTNGNLLIKDFGSNLEVFWGEDFTSYSFEGNEEFSTEENLESFIDFILCERLFVKLTNDDKARIKDELKSIFYNHSYEIFN